MKTSHSTLFFRVLCLCTILLAGITIMQCADSSQDRVCSDPLGSQNIETNTVFCFKDGSIVGVDTCLYDYCFMLKSYPTGQLIKSVYYQNCDYGSIFDMGILSCLGEVGLKPASGYVYGVVPQLHHGYVVSFPNGTYGRFFIDSWTMNAGQITKLNITRQYPY